MSRLYKGKGKERIRITYQQYRSSEEKKCTMTPSIAHVDIDIRLYQLDSGTWFGERECQNWIHVQLGKKGKEKEEC